MLLNALLFLKAVIAGCAGLMSRLLVFASGVFFVKNHAGHEISPWWIAFIILAWLLAMVADLAMNNLVKKTLRVR